MFRKDLVHFQPEDGGWLAALGATSAKAVMSLQPEDVAALSGSSETFPLDTGLASPAPRQVFVKRYRYRGWKSRLGSLFRGTLLGRSRARFEYEFLREMRRRGVPAARPIAHGERRRRGFLRDCFLLTETVPGGESLDTVFQLAVGDIRLDPAGRRALITAAGRCVRHMHEAGVFHGGLFWRNIVVLRDARGSWQCYLIDPGRRGRFHAARVPDQAAEGDLIDFASSARRYWGIGDAVRFARAYTGEAPLSAKSRHRLRRLLTKLPSAAQEAHRLAVAELIEWLRGRILRARRSQRPLVRFPNAEAMFKALDAVERLTQSPVPGPSTVRFDLRMSSGLSDMVSYTLVMGEDAVSVSRDSNTSADLVVEVDERTWLAVVNGDPEAFRYIRHRPPRIRGNTQLLPVVAHLLDTACNGTAE